VILKNKNAVIYGAAGSLGSTIAKAMASAGAQVFLTGRKIEPLQRLVNEINATGGKAYAGIVDAMETAMIDDHLDNVVKTAGNIDISFNLTGVEVRQNIPLVEMSVADFISPVTLMLKTRFLTAAAAGKRMMRQGSGVILSLTATPGGIGYPYTGGFAPACCAIENFAQNLGAELGVYGVRVLNLRSGGSPDSKVFKEAIEKEPAIMAPILQKMKSDTMLKQMPAMADVANLAVFLSSDLAGKITGVTIDITAGTTSGLNYRVASPPENP
jgi:3-oxoacyl-[acyl-carrier protein] reductase